MANKNGDLNSSRFEFLQDDIKYTRRGGCFVTSKKFIIYLLIAIVASILVGVFVYYYGTDYKVIETKILEAYDIEKLLNDSIKNLPKQEIKLPTNVHPIHYRLKLHPILDEHSPGGDTFSGQVSILLECTEKTNKIILNARNLDINAVEVTATTVAKMAPSIRSLPDDLLFASRNSNAEISTTQSTTTSTVPPTTRSNILVLTKAKSTTTTAAATSEKATEHVTAPAQDALSSTVSAGNLDNGEASTTQAHAPINTSSATLSSTSTVAALTAKPLPMTESNTENNTSTSTTQANTSSTTLASVSTAAALTAKPLLLIQSNTENNTLTGTTQASATSIPTTSTTSENTPVTTAITDANFTSVGLITARMTSEPSAGTPTATISIASMSNPSTSNMPTSNTPLPSTISTSTSTVKSSPLTTGMLSENINRISTTNVPPESKVPSQNVPTLNTPTWNASPSDSPTFITSNLPALNLPSNSTVTSDMPTSSFPTSSGSNISELDTTTQPPPKVEENSFFVRGMSTELKIKSQQEDKDNLKYIVRLKNKLEAGKKYTINIEFSGKITNNIKGLYKTTYLSDKGIKRWLLSSNFDFVYAREVFPCFDEPTFKATFEISIGRRTNMTSISNMPLKETEKMAETGWVWDHFHTTPVMSTYSVAFAVFDIESMNNTHVNAGPLLNVWAPNSKVASASYAVDVGAKILNFFERYFDINYLLPKIDLVAVPDLPKVSMENFGLIFFRDTSILVNPDTDSLENKRHIFNMVAQKLAQQWFGNIVSMKWWSDLWLTEGFALFMAAEAEASIETWMSDFTLKVTQYMLSIDDFKYSHSVHVNITNTIQINDLFDSVLHYKGGCLLRMLNCSLSGDTFQTGVQKYLNKWVGSSANETSLWESITESVRNKNDLPYNYTVGDVMNSWTKQPGYPLVTVERNYATGSINISQRNFKLSDSDDSLWIVPLNYLVGNGDKDVGKLWLTDYSITVDNISIGSNSAWILFNAQQTGYYRVNYDLQNWKLLEDTLKKNTENVPVINRGQLLNDAFELAENGVIDYKVPFEIAQYLVKEKNYIPWSSVLNSLNFIKSVLRTTYLNGAYQDYVINLVSMLYEELGPTEKENESSNDKILRALIVKTACDVRYKPCILWARSQYAAWMNSTSDNITIPFTIRQTVFCTAIEMGGQNEWEHLWNKIGSSAMTSDIKQVYLSLGCSRDPWLINRYLSYSLNGAIAWQNVPYVWQSIIHATGINVGFKFLRENWNQIYNTYKDKVFILNAIIKDFLYVLSSRSDLEDLTLFFSKHEDDLQQLSNLIQGVVDRINVRITWTKKYINSIDSWLSANNYK